MFHCVIHLKIVKTLCSFSFVIGFLNPLVCPHSQDDSVQTCTSLVPHNHMWLPKWTEWGSLAGDTALRDR
jgi:hypothetical protein